MRAELDTGSVELEDEMMLSKLRRSSRPRNARRRAFDFRFLGRFRKDTCGGVLIYTTLNIAGTSDVTLSAPTGELDDYEGILFYQDANAPADRDNKILGTSYTSLTGTLYFPNNQLRFAGTTDPGIGEWLDIIARELEIVGNTDITGNADREVPDGLISATLVE